ncbi:MAG: enoyl-CoA hydratase/isomerase family protein [Burkholderiales bacterium]|nr:enoyl-CoA hydratase/isomerase family protein [Burkholderiales bacterium]
MNGRILTERDARGVLTLTLDNPAHKNAINDAMIAALTGAFRSAAADAQCRVIVVRGAGGTFCAGREINDIAALQGAGMDALNAAYARLLDLNLAAYYCEKPVVTVLERYALGAGIMLAGWSDIALAEESCLIGYPEVKIGLPPTQTTIQLIRGVHRKAALELLLTARNIRAPEAAQLGLITRAVAADRLQAEATTVIDALLAASPEAIRRTKQMIWKTEDADYRSAIATGVDVISVAAATQSAREGIAAFIEKRRPQW